MVWSHPENGRREDSEEHTKKIVFGKLKKKKEVDIKNWQKENLKNYGIVKIENEQLYIVLKNMLFHMFLYE